MIAGGVVWAVAAVAAAEPGREFEGEAAVVAPEGVEVVEPSTTTTTTTTTPTATTATPAATATAKQPAKAEAKAAAAEKRRASWRDYRPPRLVIGGGPIVGPHAFGTEECRDEEKKCETKGTFFGVGGQVEIRGQVWKALFVHGRVLAVGNVSPAGRDPVHDGLWGLGLGFGAYAKRAFVRGEYVFVDTFGENRFALPFGSNMVGKDTWGHHAGLFSVGLRLPFKQRYGLELWGGFMAGPGSRREIPDQPDETRVLLTFLLGLNVTYDLLPARAKTTK